MPKDLHRHHTSALPDQPLSLLLDSASDRSGLWRICARMGLFDQRNSLNQKQCRRSMSP